jgi:phosphoribosyl-ATP pyrophosphohydrolase/phosphoribosyl-AMP cyclohydrolase
VRFRAPLQTYQKTIDSQKSHSLAIQTRLWTKGRELLKLGRYKKWCDGDTLLIQAKPVGPTCHTGADTCWQTRE